MGSSDEALLAGLTAGDRDASAAFVRRFQGRAYGLARTIVGDSGTAEDVAQEAFVRAWRYGASYDARRGTVVAWLLRIVRNVAVDRLRPSLAEPLDPELLASKLQLHDPRAAPVVLDMRAIKTYATLLALAGAVLIVSACGGSSDSGAGSSAPGGMNAAQTVSASTVDGVGEVLVDAQGAALYAADQETGGKVLCTEGCATIWEPLTVAAGATPTAGDGLGRSLGVVERPDGAQQVTFMDRPLYRFVEDPNPGTVTGNGFADTFDGQPFTWHVATPTGVSGSSENTPSSDGFDY